MEKAPALIEETGREYEKLFGRASSLVDAYRCDDADFVFVTSGTAGYTARVAVDELRAAGVKAGNLRIKVFRPFPFDRVREVLGKVKKAAVVDRNISYGAGGIFCQEVKSALYGRPGMPPLFGYIAGLGGRDITPDSFKEIAADAMSQDKARGGDRLDRSQDMSQDVKKEKKMTMTLPADELMACGHLACQGCGATLAMRYMLKALGPEDGALHPGLLLGGHRRALSLLVAWTFPSTTAPSRRPLRRRPASRPGST